MNLYSNYKKQNSSRQSLKVDLTSFEKKKKKLLKAFMSEGL